MRVVAAAPWTYWMALPILVLTACTLVVFVWVYLKKVVEPRLLLEEQLRALEPAGTGGRPAVGTGQHSAARSPEAVGGAGWSRGLRPAGSDGRSQGRFR